MGFEFDEFNQYRNQLLNLVNEFPQLKKRALKRMLFKLESHTIPFIPRDTGNLRASMTSKVENNNIGTMGTNVEYAQAVNDGHIQHKRYLPGKYLKGKSEGIMLKEKFIPGAHFMEKGLQSARGDMDKELDNLLKEIERKL